VASDRASSGELLEPPSDAELPVLKLLADDLSIREIGKRLFLSQNTIRSHTRALYRKLGVHARSDAVARATTLGLLGQNQSPERKNGGGSAALVERAPLEGTAEPS
jgi:ATP/maltotriose-dependent transcriptional regulator MalT